MRAPAVAAMCLGILLATAAANFLLFVMDVEDDLAQFEARERHEELHRADLVVIASNLNHYRQELTQLATKLDEARREHQRLERGALARPGAALVLTLEAEDRNEVQDTVMQLRDLRWHPNRVHASDERVNRTLRDAQVFERVTLTAARPGEDGGVVAELEALVAREPVAASDRSSHPGR
jgi:hypothetical protein